MKSTKDRAGERYERLVLISKSDERDRDGTFLWVCLCDCGNNLTVRVRSLQEGKTKSCGCLHKEKTAARLVKRNTTHGHAVRGKVSSTYRHWQYIFDRLKYDPDYYGVSVCSRWSKFENFLEDMGECSPGLTLDRIDNSKGYGPGNCRWATNKDQQNNRTNNLVLGYKGQYKTLTQWCEHFEWPYEYTRRAYHRMGKPEDFVSQWEGLRDPLDM